MAMSLSPRVLLAWLLGLALVVGIAAASHAPWRAHPAPDGVLRLSLSARPERVERCRTLSAEELASRPAHMRQPVICDGEAATYRLVVARNSAILFDEEVTGGGARGDRPIHVLREFPLPAGPSHLSVSLSRTDTPEPAATESGGTARGTEGLPRTLHLDTTVTVAARRVVMVTYDPIQRRLLALTAPREP